MERIQKLHNDILEISLQIERESGSSKMMISQETASRNLLQSSMKDIQDKLLQENAKTQKMQEEIMHIRPKINVSGNASLDLIDEASHGQNHHSASDIEMATKVESEKRQLSELADVSQATRLEMGKIRSENASVDRKLRDLESEITMSRQALFNLGMSRPQQSMWLDQGQGNENLRDLTNETVKLRERTHDLQQKLDKISGAHANHLHSGASQSDVGSIKTQLQNSVNLSLAAVRVGDLDVQLQRKLEAAEDAARDERVKQGHLMEQVAEARQQLRFAELESSSFESEAETAGREAVRGRSDRKDLERRLEAVKDELYLAQRQQDHTTAAIDAPVRGYGSAGQDMASYLILEAKSNRRMMPSDLRESSTPHGYGKARENIEAGFGRPPLSVDDEQSRRYDDLASEVLGSMLKRLT